MARVSRTDCEEKIRREAKRLFDSGATVSDFSARFFGGDGMLRDLWSTETERRKLIASPLYRELKAQLASIRERDALAFERDVETFSGRLTVVVPKSLHAGLRVEAAREGVSLAELIRLKLGVPYRMSVRLMTQSKAESEAA